MKLSTDRKTASRVRRAPNGDDKPTAPNAFGLTPGPITAGGSCQVTPFCKSCYAVSTSRRFRAVDTLLSDNLAELLPIVDDADALTDTLRPLVAESIRKQTAQGVAVPLFRWFWAGDLPSAAFGTAVRRLALEFSSCRFWIYTRSLNYVHRLIVPTKPDNLAVYLSVDAWNLEHASQLRDKFGDRVRLAFCAENWTDAAELAARIGETAPRCPELTGQIPLVVYADDHAKFGEGACSRCQLCTNGRGNVAFAVDRTPTAGQTTRREVLVELRRAS